MSDEKIIKKIEIIYEEYIKLYKNILEKNNVECKNNNTFLEYSNIMKSKFTQIKELIEQVEFFFFNSDDKKSDILEILMEDYEIIRKKYNENR